MTEAPIAIPKADRKNLIDPTIAAHYRRVFKMTGDGLLVELGCVVDAARCAIAIQNGMINRNKDISQNRRIVFRIGINTGDILIETDDILGDGRYWLHFGMPDCRSDPVRSRSTVSRDRNRHPSLSCFSSRFLHLPPFW
jgi:hypothetical protein